jgi:hypothetical protein
MTTLPSPDPQYALFARTLGQRFTVSPGPGTTVDLELTGLAGDPPTGAAGSYSVLFDGPASATLPQGTYEFTHPEEDAFPLFIVPIGRVGDSIRYEAVFTRLATP